MMATMPTGGDLFVLCYFIVLLGLLFGVSAIGATLYDRIERAIRKTDRRGW